MDRLVLTLAAILPMLFRLAPDAAQAQTPGHYGYKPALPSEQPNNGLASKADAYKVGITPQDCGAVGDGIADDTPFVAACAAKAFAANRPLLLTSYYRMTSQFVVDTAPYATRGVQMVGAAVASTGLKFDSTVPAPNFLVENAAGGPSFYSRFFSFNLQCAVAGVCAQFGRSDLGDQLNELVVDLLVQNASATPAAVTAAFINAYQPDARLVSNGAGRSAGGTALLLRQTQFGRFFGSIGNATTAIHLADGYNVSNTFDTLDLEEATLGVLIDGADSFNNVFRGGHVADVTNVVEATAGSGNRWEFPDLGLPSTLFFVGPITGFEVEFGSHAAVAGTPAVPASGAARTNNLGQSYMVNMVGGTVSSVTVSGVTVCISSPCAFVLHQDQTVVATYTSAPGWVWSPL